MSYGRMVLHITARRLVREVGQTNSSLVRMYKRALLSTHATAVLIAAVMNLSSRSKNE